MGVNSGLQMTYPWLFSYGPLPVDLEEYFIGRLDGEAFR